MIETEMGVLRSSEFSSMSTGQPIQAAFSEVIKGSAGGKGMEPGLKREKEEIKRETAKVVTPETHFNLGKKYKLENA